ncbi:hypothetical protein EVAR_19284_1 [Eumeta japonica]|uniref:Uncharacterized protein n=1 Tax=Eumeta variegata TaxID=151549 RepID=A0A4C1UDI0_EUMVA|nr:hypothetical protein EVAR_19284_1 [Eumeta japonica]
MPASSRRGYDPDGSSGGPLTGGSVTSVSSPICSPVLGFGRRCSRQFSREGSAARRPLLHRCDVPEEFIGALVSDVKHPAGDVLDEFLYGFDAEVASDYVI